VTTFASTASIRGSPSGISCTSRGDSGQT
jgi:hypothetical protein